VRVQLIEAGSRRSGVSLVMVGLSVSMLATLSVSMLVAARSITREKSAQREEIASLFAAEAGLSEAVYSLNTGGAGNVGTQQQPLSINQSQYWVTAADLPNGMKSLTATGIDNRSGTRIELTLRQAQDDLWSWAAFGAEQLDMAGDARVDSYDSTLGTYASQQVNGSGTSAYAMSNGAVGSNGDVALSADCAVQGDAVPGPSGTASVTGNATVSGATTPNTGTVTLPALQIPVIGSAGDLNVVNAAPLTLAAGDYEYDDVVLDNGALWTLTGPSRVVIKNIELRSNATIVVDASAGPVELYVYDDFIMNDNTSIGSTTETPADVAIHLNSDNIVNPTQVVLGSSSMLFGTLFAPNASIDIDTNFELFGSLVARRVHLADWSRVHFDEALLNGNGNAAGATWEAVCWRRLGFKP
jgi:hypothetical protein